MNETRLSAVIFIRKNRSKSFYNGIVYNGVGFKCICTNISRQYTELFYKLFTTATESGRSMGGCNFRNNLPINVPKCHGGKLFVFWRETFRVVKILLSGTWFHACITDIVEAMNTLFQEKLYHKRNLYHC